MILKAIKLVLFWRKNNLPSIVFKSLVWGALAWLAVGIFTNLSTALISGGIVATIKAGLYGLSSLKRQRQLLEKVGGDKEMLARLNKASNTKGLAGSLMAEMLRAELDADDDEYEEPQVDEATQEANRLALASQIARLRDICVSGGYCSEEVAADAVNELNYSFGDGNSLPDTEDYLCAFLPDNILMFEPEAYGDEGDHAYLVQEFSDATHGNWVVEHCESHYDENSDKWVVNFTQGEEKKTWCFTQSSDWLSEAFLRQVTAYVGNQTGYIVTTLNSEDFIQIACLPLAVHEELIASGEMQHAA